jgi:NAD(P)-dependent dehydrogenase (short-subunit alcohol dehydrogenase family)
MEMTSKTTDITDHVIIVTGAGSGIGRQIAVRLASQGAIVAACDRNISAVAEIAGETIHPYHVDFTSEDSIDECVSEVERDLGPLNALVNCVGILGENGQKVVDVDIENFDFVYSVNLRGALIITKAVIGGMEARGYGRILHLASISGKEGNPLLVAYSSTKAGLIGLVKSVGKEYAGSGVTVNALAPALIQSPMTDSFSDSQLTYLKGKIPIGRLGTTDEVSDLASWIVSPACSFTTGFTFDLSGGRATY